jgi:demethylmenaquinone methyltransferase/2-methoxy-6-polyprenyl-1,4-benzoquinol methylase
MMASRQRDETMASTPTVDKRESRIRGMFGSIAPVYDFLNHLLSLNIDRHWRSKTTRLVPPGPDGPILDVCTGTGDLALAYDRAAGGKLPIWGTDFCRPMLLLAQKKTRKAKCDDRVRYLESDTQHLPFPSDMFQLTTVAFGLRNVTDTDRGLAEMVRVTRPGGRVAILEFSKPKNWVLGGMYGFYFRRILPTIGRMFSRSPDDAYSYLPASVMEFPDGEVLAEKLRQHTLTDVKFWPMTFGIATLYVGTKPGPVGASPSEAR